jgi:hypothetical protein
LGLSPSQIAAQLRGGAQGPNNLAYSNRSPVVSGQGDLFGQNQQQLGHLGNQLAIKKFDSANTQSPYMQNQKGLQNNKLFNSGGAG